MIERNFFECLSLANVEKVHTQILAWIFSSCKIFSDDDKSRLLNILLETNRKYNIINVIPEYERVDLIIECTDTIIGIENKIKSGQHSDQLSRYEKVIDDFAVGKNKEFLFLTLISERAENTRWKNSSYERIVDFLFPFTKSDDFSFDNQIIREYYNAIYKLVKVLQEFIDTPEMFPSVFENCSKKIQAKKNIKYPTDGEKYIGVNNLETIFLKNYLSLVVDTISKEDFRIKVSETKGEPLIDAIHSYQFRLDGRKYQMGIQYQGNTYKYFIVYENYQSEISHSSWLNEVKLIMQKLKEEQLLDLKKVNIDKKAWISLSKKRNLKLHKISSNDFADELKIAIDSFDIFKDKMILELSNLPGFEDVQLNYKNVEPSLELNINTFTKDADKVPESKKKIGAFVQETFGSLVNNHQLESYLPKLLDKKVSQEYFNLSYPFLVKDRSLFPLRYYSNKYVIGGDTYYLTNDWIEDRHRPKYENWLRGFQ